MDKPSPAMRDLAQRLLALEAANESASDPQGHEGVRVCEKLRVSLTRFAGADGFTALMRRALILARADCPSLQSVRVNADGRLESLEELTADPEKLSIDAAMALTAHLLGLLATFIGEPLTLRLVRETWSDSSLVE